MSTFFIQFMKEGTRRVAALDQKRKWDNSQCRKEGVLRWGCTFRCKLVRIRGHSKTMPCGAVFSTGPDMKPSPSYWYCTRPEPNVTVRPMLPLPREGEDRYASQTSWKYRWLGPAPRNGGLGLSLKICILTSSRVTLTVSNPPFK